MLHTELVPLVKCDHSCALKVHGVEHVLPGQLLLFCLVQLRIHRSIGGLLGKPNEVILGLVEASDVVSRTGHTGDGDDF